MRTGMKSRVSASVIWFMSVSCVRIRAPLGRRPDRLKSNQFTVGPRLTTRLSPIRPSWPQQSWICPQRSKRRLHPFDRRAHRGRADREPGRGPVGDALRRRMRDQHLARRRRRRAGRPPRPRSDRRPRAERRDRHAVAEAEDLHPVDLHRVAVQHMRRARRRQAAARRGSRCCPAPSPAAPRSRRASPSPRRCPWRMLQKSPAPITRSADRLAATISAARARARCRSEKARIFMPRSLSFAWISRRSAQASRLAAGLRSR